MEKASYLSIESKKWVDLKSDASNPDLVVYQCSNTRFFVEAYKDGKVYAYLKFVPQDLDFSDEESGKRFADRMEYKLECGVDLVKKLIKTETGRTRIRFIIPDTFDAKTWLSIELQARMENIGEGRTKPRIRLET